jgi:hypothetical protein
MNRLKASALVLLLSTSFGGCTRPVVQPTATTDSPTTIEDLTAPAIPADIAAQLSLPSTLDMSGFGSDTAPADSGGGINPALIFGGLAAGGLALWYFKFRKGKVDVDGQADEALEQVQKDVASGNPGKADQAISQIPSFKKAFAEVNTSVRQQIDSLGTNSFRSDKFAENINLNTNEYTLLLNGKIGLKGLKTPGDLNVFIKEVHQGNYTKLAGALTKETNPFRQISLINGYYKKSAIDLAMMKGALYNSVKEGNITPSTYDQLLLGLDNLLATHKKNANNEILKITQKAPMPASLNTPEYTLKNYKFNTKWMDDPKNGAWNKVQTFKSTNPTP